MPSDQSLIAYWYYSQLSVANSQHMDAADKMQGFVFSKALKVPAAMRINHENMYSLQSKFVIWPHSNKHIQSPQHKTGNRTLSVIHRQNSIKSYIYTNYVQKNDHLYSWDNDVRLQQIHLYFLNKWLRQAWPRRWHLHCSYSHKQWRLLAENRAAICHCTLIKFIQGHCVAWKIDVKSINQSQMDYVLYGLGPIAYTERYGGLKGHERSVSAWIHMHQLCRWPVSDDDHWLTILMSRASRVR